MASLSQYVADFSSHSNATDYAFRSRLREDAINLENGNRRLFAQQRNALEIKDPYATLVPVYLKDKNKFWDTLPLLTEEEAIPVVLKIEAESRRKTGVPSVVEKADFLINWKIFTEASLQYMNWDNVFAAGGSVLACLLPMPESATKNLWQRREYLRSEFPGSDIDLFLYGLNEEEAKKKMVEIYQAVVESVPHEVLAFRTPNAVSIISQHPFRHIQIVLRLYSSPAEILTGFDVDCCTVGFDGKGVWSTRRGHFAITTQCNIIDNTRRSPSYEVRLAKYSERGFEIRVPGLDRSRIDPQLYERSYEKTQGLARLLLFETLRTPRERINFKELQRTHKFRPPHPDAGQYMQYDYQRNDDLKSQGVDSNDYNTVYLPYGPTWTARRIAKLAHRKDFVLNHPALMHQFRSTRHHQHALFYGTMDDVLGDCCTICPPRPAEFEEDEKKLYVSGDLSFIVDDPGRQEIGSFHPITDEDWTEGAYVPENITERVKAIVDNDVESFKKICSHTLADLNSRDWMGRTPLLLSVLCNSSGIVEYLISENVKLALTLPDGRNPLHICAEYGYIEIARMILAKSKENEVLAKTSDSIKEKSVIALSAVDSVGSFVNIDEADIYEIDTKDTDVKDEDVICEDDGPDFIDLTTVEWDYNMTPLHFAILYGNEEICRLLITAGANPRKRIKLEAGRGYYSPASFISNLRLASLCADREKSEKLLTILFSHRLSLTQTISFGNVSDQSLLHLAMYDNERVPGLGLELLETYHRLASPSDWVAAVNYISSAFESPLMLAAKNGYVSTVKFLLEHGAEPNISSGECEKAFPRLQKNNQCSYAINYTFKNSPTEMANAMAQAAELALRAGNHECLKLLVEHGADLKERKDLLNDVLTVTISNQINSVEYCKKSALNSSEMVVQKPVYEGWRAFVAKIAEDSLQVAKESDGERDIQKTLETLSNDSDGVVCQTYYSSPKERLAFEERSLRRMLLCEKVLLDAGCLKKEESNASAKPTGLPSLLKKENTLSSLAFEGLLAIGPIGLTPFGNPTFGSVTTGGDPVVAMSTLGDAFVDAPPLGGTLVGGPPLSGTFSTPLVAGSLAPLVNQSQPLASDEVLISHFLPQQQVKMAVVTDELKAIPPLTSYRSGHKNGRMEPVKPADNQKYEDLFSAAWDGNDAKIVELTQKGPQIDRVLVSCTGEGFTPLMVSLMRGHVETAKLLFKIAMEQRKTPDIKMSTKGANARINNYEMMDDYGECDDEYEDYDDEEEDYEDEDDEEEDYDKEDDEEEYDDKEDDEEEYDEDGDDEEEDNDEIENEDMENENEEDEEDDGEELRKEENDDRGDGNNGSDDEDKDGVRRSTEGKNMNKAKKRSGAGDISDQAKDEGGSDYSLLHYLQISSPVCPVVSMKSALPESIELRTRETNISLTAFEMCIMVGGIVGIRHYLDMVRKAVLIENGFILDAHEAGAKVADAVVTKIRMLIKNPTLARVVTEFVKGNDQIRKWAIMYDDVDVFEFIMRETLANLDVADFLPELGLEDVVVSDTIVVKTPKYEMGITPPSMQKKPISSSQNDKIELDTLLHSCAYFGSIKILQKLLSENSLEGYLAYYRDNQPADDVRANFLRRSDVSLEMLSKRILAFEQIPENHKYVSKVTPLQKAVQGNQPKVIALLSELLPAKVKDDWFLNLKDTNGRLPIHNAVGKDLDCLKAIIDGCDASRAILAVDTKRSWNPLHFAASQSLDKAVNYLLQACPPDRVSDLLSAKSKLYEQTPLMVAAHSAKLSTFKLLQEAVSQHGITRERDVWGRSTLHESIRALKVERTKLAREYESNTLDMEDHAGLTPFDAISQKLRELFKDNQLPERTYSKGKDMPEKDDAETVSYNEVLQLVQPSNTGIFGRRVFSLAETLASTEAAIKLAADEN